MKQLSFRLDSSASWKLHFLCLLYVFLCFLILFLCLFIQYLLLNIFFDKTFCLNTSFSSNVFLYTHCVKYRNFTNFLLRDICGNAHFPHSFGQIAKKFGEITVIYTLSVSKVTEYWKALMGRTMTDRQGGTMVW